MINETAVSMIMNKRKKTLNPAKKLAYEFAMQDIVCSDVDDWLSTPVYEHLHKFIKHGDDIIEEISQYENIHEYDIKDLLRNSMRVSHCMYHYASIHQYIKDKSLSES